MDKHMMDKMDKYMRRRKKNDAIITIALPGELKDILKGLAQAESLLLSNLIRDILWSAVEEEEKEEEKEERQWDREWEIEKDRNRERHMQESLIKEMEAKGDDKASMSRIISDFFRINLPYGIMGNNDMGWFAFNRNYKPVGFHTTEDIKYTDYPIFTKYRRHITESKMRKWDINGEPFVKDGFYTIYFYNDANNPMKSISNWKEYSRMIRRVSSMKGFLEYKKMAATSEHSGYSGSQESTAISEHSGQAAGNGVVESSEGQ